MQSDAAMLHVGEPVVKESCDLKMVLFQVMSEVYLNDDVNGEPSPREMCVGSQVGGAGLPGQQGKVVGRLQRGAAESGWRYRSISKSTAEANY